jgi:type I restriction enzyme S subunit
MAIDIRPDHYSIIQKILREHLPHQKIMVFGSRAKGTSTLTSDLDLCLMGEEKLSFERLAALQDAFSLSLLPYKVDIVEWSKLTPEFKALIKPEITPISHDIDR